MTFGDLLQFAAVYLPVWRDAAVASLAGVDILCLWVIGAVVEPT